MADIVFTPSGVAELEAQFKRDLRLAAIDTGITQEPPTGPGTDWHLLSVACSNFQLLSLGNVRVAATDINVLTATGQPLDDQRVALGLPEVGASKATGRIVPDVQGPATILNNQRFIYPNGSQGRVVGSYVGITQGTEINVEAVDPGTTGNLPGGATVRFSPAPVNIATEAEVSRSFPISGGTDFETDERKRTRILNTQRNKPAGGNWGYVRQIILDELGGVQDVYIYPALGGPSTAKVVPVRSFDVDNRDFSRVVSSTLLARVRQVIWSKVPIGDKLIAQAAEDQLADFTLRLAIPDSALTGGSGLGWADATVWPQLEAADNDTVQVDAVGANNDVLTLDASTATAPVAGQTNIAWWSIPDRRFYTALVVGVSGSAGAWVVTLDRPLLSQDGQGPQVDDYVCPAAQNLDGYASRWIELFRELGAGENTTDAGRLPRSRRHPYVTDEDPSDVTSVVLGQFAANFPEITDYAFGHAPTTSPTVPATADDAPSVLVPRRFAIYKK